MNFVELYFIVIYRAMFRPLKHSNREHDDGGDAKFRAFMFTCLVFYMNMEYLLLLFCYVFLRRVLIFVTMSSLMTFGYVFLTLTTLFGYLWFYRLKDVNLMEQRYLQLSRRKRRVAIVSVVLFTVMTFFVTGFFFINKKVLPNL